MKTLRVSLLYIVSVAVGATDVGTRSWAQGAEPKVVRTFRWSELEKEKRLLSGRVERQDGAKPNEWLVVGGQELGTEAIPLLEIEAPPVKGPGYMLRGRVRYSDVAGDGYLEMWSHFPDGGMYFSRTLGDTGPMGKLKGTVQKWRVFILPFHLEPPPGEPAPPPPSKLVVNLVLPGAGRVELAELELVQFPPEKRGAPAAWWEAPTGGIIGGVYGTLLGASGALAGFLRATSAAHRGVQYLSRTWCAVGAVLAVVGLAAWYVGQPVHVHLPLWLSGGMSLVVMGGLGTWLGREARGLELRRMEARDATWAP